MTKKRFVKLLMSHGIQRNDAQEIAERYNARSYAYANAYRDFVCKTAVKKAFAQLSEAMQEAAIKVTSVISAFEEFKRKVEQNDG